MRFTILFITALMPTMLNAQKLAIGGFITPTYGNIVYKSKSYDPVFAIGGGLAVNYYKNRWMFNTGLNLKNVGGSQKIPVTTVAQPEGTGEFVKSVTSIKLLTVPLGINYSFIVRERFKVYLGLNIENGRIISHHLSAGNGYQSQKMTFDNNKKYYLGIMPDIGSEWHITPGKFVFVNIGASYSLTTYTKYYYTNFVPQLYRINNLFINIGFGYRLKK